MTNVQITIPPKINILKLTNNLNTWTCILFAFQVASRRVFQVFGLIFILCSILGKFGACFITLPDAVLGGTTLVGIGIFIGLVLSNMQYIDMGSTRNLAIIGISILVGLMIPYWTKNNSDFIDTGNSTLIISHFVSAVLSFYCSHSNILKKYLHFHNFGPSSTDQEFLFQTDRLVLQNLKKKCLTMLEVGSSSLINVLIQVTTHKYIFTFSEYYPLFKKILTNMHCLTCNAFSRLFCRSMKRQIHLQVN